jgi:hypothetical protein
VPARARLRAGRPVRLAGRGRQRGRPVAGAGGQVAGGSAAGLVPAPTTTPRTATVTTVWIPRGPLSRISVESTVLGPAAHPDNRTGILGTGSLGAWAPAGPRSTARTGRGGGRTAEGSSCRAAPATQVGSGTTSRGLPLRRRRALPPGAARPRVGGDGLGGHRRAGRGEPSDPAPGPRQPPADRQRPGRRCGQPTGLPARLVRPAPRTPRTQPARRRAAGRALGHDRGHGEPGRRRLRRHLLGRTLDPVPPARPVPRRAARGRPARGAVQGNGATATVDGDLPEGDGGHPSFTRAWLGRNWCGSRNVSLRVGGPGGAVIPARTLQRPACADPGKPSTLEPTPLPIRPNG